MGTLRLLVVGLGPIGTSAARLAARARSLEIVGAVDIDPAKEGADLGELLGEAGAAGIRVEGNLSRAVERVRPELALVCTASYLERVEEDLLLLAGAGVHVVSPCEELLLPDLSHPEIAARIDAAARQGGATVLGTGVNPGFVLDFLPVIASAACSDVRRVRGTRILDAAARRQPLQEKVGAGLERERFDELVREGKLGHVGMRQSVALVGLALGLALDSVHQSLDAVIAERDVATRFVSVRRGQVAGIRNLGLGRRGSDLVVELELQMYVGALDPHDEIHLDGEPDLHLRFEGGIPGDQATAAILVNTARQVVAAPPGLKTILDVPPPRLAR